MNQSTGYIFLSYKREEVEKAELLRKVLEEAKFKVWWDRDIQCGEVWSEVLDEAVRKASCIVVLWSDKSMQSRWVMHEASSAMDRGIYAPVRIVLVEIEPPYDRIQATDMLHWDGSAQHPGVLRLLYRVKQLLPPEQSTWERVVQTIRQKRATVLSVLFAILALGILVWQTMASQQQLQKQESVIGELGTFRAEQAKTSLSQNKQQKDILNQLVTFQKDQKKSGEELLTGLKDSERIQAKSAQLFEVFRDQQEILFRSQQENLNKLINQQNESATNLRLATLASLEMNSIRVTWTFDTPPAWIDELIKYGYASDAYRFYSLDEMGAWGNTYRSRVMNSVHVDHVLNPAIIGLAKNYDQIDSLYEGSIDALLEAKVQDLDADSLAVFGVEYSGNIYEVMLPLSADNTAVLSLAKALPDSLSGYDANNYNDNYLGPLTPYPFTASVENNSGKLVFAWDYPADSFNPVRKKTQRLTGLLPKTFNLIIVHGKMEPEDYLDQLGEFFTAIDPSDKPTMSWSKSSTLRIVINGIDDLAYSYEVTNLGEYVAERRIIEEEYLYQFTFTKFRCVRK
jgi:hypothetical protein